MTIAPTTLLVALLAISLGTWGCGDKKTVDTDEMGEMGAGVGGGSGGKLWQNLSAYKDTHLRSWKSAFKDARPEARDVLDAFQELGYATTGPTGFWRKKVPNQWFGCESDPTSVPCQTLRDTAEELEAWDAFQAEIADLAEGKEHAFLARNQAKMNEYLETFVPARHSESDMKATGFYKNRLAEGLEAGPSAGDDDL